MDVLIFFFTADISADGVHQAKSSSVVKEIPCVATCTGDDKTYLYRAISSFLDEQEPE